jgi:ABC-2 type transport system ATP-binding protein
MIVIEHLYKSYDKNPVLDDVALTIREGAITGLLGPNGAGKTTLISILMGLIAKDRGKITIGGLDIDREPAKIRSQSSLIPQTLALYPTLTACENLEYFGALYGLSGKTLRTRIERSIDIASLQSFINKKTDTFSGGMKRRLNMAIGLLNDPQILYLDEPTVGVDAQSRSYMLEMIRKLNAEQRTTIIYTSHYMDEIEQVSDDIAIIDEGRIVLHDRKERVLAHKGDARIGVESLTEEAASYLVQMPGVTLEGTDILVEKNGLFRENMARVFSLLEERRVVIRDISFGSRSLEDLFLRLTHSQLRDE